MAVTFNIEHNKRIIISYLKIIIFEEHNKRILIFYSLWNSWTDKKLLVKILFSCIHNLANFSQTRAPRGTDRSPEYNEHFCYKLDSRVKNLTTEWNQKQQHFITHAFRSLL